MKRLMLSILCVVAFVCSASAQKPILKYLDARELTLIGKIFPTRQAYYRLDTVKYNKFTGYQNRLLHFPSGMALCFKTNSSQIHVKTFYKFYNTGLNMTPINTCGYDLYIKKDGNWLYANSAATGAPKADSETDLDLINHMNTNEKECLLYLPLFSIIDSIQIGIDDNADIASIPNPFRHRIVIFGSSFTHGTSSCRPGMSYPMQLERSTGFYFMNLGVSGNSTLQQSFAKVLADADADAFVFDAFSNPTAQMIAERFKPFIETIRKAHPTTPLIFMQTIYRERRNFDMENDKSEQAKMDMAEKVVREAMKTDKNIYFIYPSTGDDHMTSTDGTHPSDFGYYRWAMSVKPQIMKILAKYGIK